MKQLRSRFTKFQLMALLLAVVAVGSGIYLLTAQAASFVSLPNGTVSNGGWVVAPSGTADAAVADGTTANQTNYIQAPLNSADALLVQFDTSSPTNVQSATQLVVNINSRIVTVSRSTADTVTVEIYMNNALVTGATATFTPNTTAYTWLQPLTVTGSWTQAALDSMQVRLTRTILGTAGSTASRADDLRVASVYVDVTYTQNVQLTQNAYRWYGNSTTTTTSDTLTKLSDPTSLPTGSGFSATWTPDGQYLSIAHATSPSLTNYKRSGDAFTKLPDPASLPAGNGVGSAWSPDGQYLSVGHTLSPFVTIYKRSGDTFTKLSDPASLPAGAGQSAAWSPDGQYLTIAHATSPFITIYKRSGDTFTKLSDPAAIPSNTGKGVSWSPDGVYLNIVFTSSPYMITYKRSGDTFTKLSDPVTMPTGFGYGSSFSPDGQYLTIAHTTSPFVTIYKRSGDTFTKLSDPASLPAGNANGASWSPNGQYMSISLAISPYTTIYKRSGDTFTKLSDPSFLISSTMHSSAWSPDGQVLVGVAASSPYIIIYKQPSSVDIGAPLASANTFATAPAPGQPFRLRLNIGASGGDLASGDYKLRYYYSSTGTCSATATYADVTTSTPIRFYDNVGVIDKIGVTTNANDPTRTSITTVRQSYNETNPFSVTSTILSGQDGIWDFALTFDPAANQTGAYCLKATTNTDADLTTYSQIPAIAAPVTTYAQSSYRVYQNADSVVPGAPLTSQNSVASMAPGTAFRLRQLIRADGSSIPANQSFRLQYASKASTCSVATFTDIPPQGPVGSSSPASNGSSATTSGTGASWTNPTGALAPGGTVASFTAGTTKTTSQLIETTGYGFAIPSGATINGIAVTLGGMNSVSGVSQDWYRNVGLLRGGTKEAYVLQGLRTQNTTTDTIGSSTNLWNAAWTPEDINSSGFGVSLQLEASARTVAETYNLDSITITVYYSIADAPISYYDNASAGNKAAINTYASDPDDSGRTIVYYAYQESNPFAIGAAPLSAGQSGMWDFALYAKPTTLGTYCLRAVKGDGTGLTTYLQYPEVIVGASGPTIDQQLRGGQAVVNGVKSPFSW